MKSVRDGDGEKNEGKGEERGSKREGRDEVVIAQTRREKKVFVLPINLKGTVPTVEMDTHLQREEIKKLLTSCFLTILRKPV
jgi:hypothetical protein